MLDLAKIKRLRKAKRLSQAEAAQLAGMDLRQRWSDIEAGRRENITLDTLRRIAETLDVKPKDLLK
jgi:transcriptional regulator with XRE-family HTH domain